MAKQRRNAGGVAGNAGSEYQHRIGAFISALMIARVDLSLLVASDQKLGAPTSLCYETLKAIDDINVATDNGSRAYIQVKRSITKPVLQKVFEQFAQQYKSENPDHKTIYSLVTSSRSSYAASHQAKMVLEVLRAAPSEDFSPSHNEDLQGIYYFLIEAATKALKGAELSHEDEDVREFLQLVHIDIFDIEENEQMEKATLLLLFRYASNEAQFLWNKLLSDNARAASNRMTLEREALELRYQEMLRGDGEASQWFFDIAIDAKEIPVGIEYLLVEMPDDRAAIDYLGLKGLSAADVVFWATSRFDQACRKILKFSGDQCILPNGKAFRLLARAASAGALTRILESRKLIDLQKLKAAGNKIVLHGEKVKAGVYNKSGCARKYRPTLLTAFYKNANPSRCLVCGLPAMEQGILTVEIDEEGNELEIGLVHAECLKPAYRVIGTVSGTFLDMFPVLRRFDADAYIRALPGGHGAFMSLPPKKQETVFVIAWSGEEYNPYGAFCLQVELANGNHVLAIHRGRVERLDKPIAEQKAKQMNEIIQRQVERCDPMCVKMTENGHVYGKRSIIEDTNKESGELVPAIFVKIVRFEERAAKALDQYKNWYAPLCYFRRIDDQTILTINRSIVLLTNPFSITSLAAGLEPLGINLQEFETRVIASDVDFDRLAREIFNDERSFVVDPTWDEEGYLEPKAKIAPGTVNRIR
ncbi:hypothetical protein ACW7BJ_33840 [Azospirillum argentinense]